MRLIGILAAIGFILSLIVHVGTFFDHGSMQAAGWLHVLLFPLIIPMVVILNRRGQNNMTAIQEMLPRWAQLLAKATTVYVVLNFVLFFMHAAEGSPRRKPDGSYVLENHGHVLATITKDEFVHRKALETRGFSGHWMLFYLMPALYFGLVYRPDEPATASAATPVAKPTGSDPPV